jgi:hypothetical protein
METILDTGGLVHSRQSVCHGPNCKHAAVGLQAVINKVFVKKYNTSQQSKDQGSCNILSHEFSREWLFNLKLTPAAQVNAFDASVPKP